MELYYYSHRYRAPDPDVQAANLSRAEERLALMRAHHPDLCIVAPWIELALVGAPDHLAWRLIRATITCCDVILLDHDGAPPSDGMRLEEELARQAGLRVQVVS